MSVKMKAMCSVAIHINYCFAMKIWGAHIIVAYVATRCDLSIYSASEVMTTVYHSCILHE